MKKMRNTHIPKMIIMIFVATIFLTGMVTSAFALSVSMPNNTDGVLIGRYSCEWNNNSNGQSMYSQIVLNSTGGITPVDFNVGGKRIDDSIDCTLDASPVRKLALDLGCTPSNLSTWAHDYGDSFEGGGGFSFICKAKYKDLINIIAEMGKAILQTTTPTSYSTKEADKK
jgi:hypothetical protein